MHEREVFRYFKAPSVSIERSSGNRPEALQGLGKEPGTVSATGDASENRQFGEAEREAEWGKTIVPESDIADIAGSGRILQ